MATCLEDVPVRFRQNIIAGIDWGGGGVARTAIVIGFARPEGTFEICHLAQISGREDPEQVRTFIAEICRRFKVRWIGADGLGSGSIFNRLLLSELNFSAHFYAIYYAATDSNAYQDGVLWKWPIARTASIGYMISCIQKKKIKFPRVADCSPYLDEFACEVAQYDEQNRTIKYTHPVTHPDDTLHACNYALQMVARGFPSLASYSS